MERFLPTKGLFDGKFEILSQLGSGAMGAVYKARQKDLGRLVALKLLRAEPLTELSSARLEREARALSELHHKSIVSVYSYGVCEGCPYLVLEYVEGDSLESELSARSCFTVATTLRLMQQLCEALAYTHRHGIIHRDLKPANIIVIRDADGVEHLKVVDLGLAKILPASTATTMQKLTETGFTVGTVDYMSPEQCAADIVVDHRMDIYSIGIIMYRCLTGELPFQSEDIFELMRQHVAEPPKPLSNLGVSEETVTALQFVINKALAKNPDKRYESADAMLADLKAIEDDNGRSLVNTVNVKEAARSVSETHPRFRTTRRPLLGVVIVSMVLGICGWFLFDQNRSSAMIYEDVTRTWRANLSDSQRQDCAAMMRKALRRNQSDHLLDDVEISSAIADDVLLQGLEKRDPEYILCLGPSLTGGVDRPRLDFVCRSWAKQVAERIDGPEQWDEVVSYILKHHPNDRARVISLIQNAPIESASPVLLEKIDALVTYDGKYPRLDGSLIAIRAARRWNELGRPDDHDRLIKYVYASYQPDPEWYPELCEQLLRMGDWEKSVVIADKAIEFRNWSRWAPAPELPQGVVLKSPYKYGIAQQLINAKPSIFNLVGPTNTALKPAGTNIVSRGILPSESRLYGIDIIGNTYLHNPAQAQRRMTDWIKLVKDNPEVDLIGGMEEFVKTVKPPRQSDTKLVLQALTAVKSEAKTRSGS